MPSVIVSSTAARFRQNIITANVQLTADEPLESGGDGAGLAPFEFILAGLGACTAMTVKMYAERKGWPLTHVVVELMHQKVNDRHQLLAQLHLKGDLTQDQQQRLLEIADRCPVHRLLTSEIEIQTSLV
ncbi:OsmC family protein [Stenomitos frigidus]|uniref:Osmotically inducible protein OsmC n=1 Tax=Stenomitos frigidus ULC18 TaxID=2107698 RepID=A0A2T1ECB4_9CYAN|nr:OsmC family protein [Stenomitos frigidus]PSB30323.1 osmotically inducible protein OsmC [Stenomitos frigidus ULC18]